jgi:hypothetical protein
LSNKLREFISRTLFSDDLEGDGSFAGARLVKVDKIDMAEFAELQLSVYDGDTFAAPYS